MAEKKYELTDEMIKIDKHFLHRIRALKDFGDVKKGDLGGFIEKEENLSQDGDCWVYGDAKVYYNAVISNDAKVYGNALVYEDAKVFGNAKVYERASVSGRAMVYGNAKVCGSADVCCNIRVTGNAEISKGIVWEYGRKIDGSKNKGIELE